MWNLLESKEEFSLEGHSDSINTIAYNQKLGSLISASNDFSLKFWDLNNPNSEFEVIREMEYSLCVKSANKTDLVALGFNNGKIKF